MKQCVPFRFTGDGSEQRWRHPIRRMLWLVMTTAVPAGKGHIGDSKSIGGRLPFLFILFLSVEKRAVATNNEHFGKEFQRSMEMDMMVYPFSSGNPDKCVRVSRGSTEGTLYRSHNQSSLNRLFKRIQDVLETEEGQHSLAKANTPANSMASF